MAITLGGIDLGSSEKGGSSVTLPASHAVVSSLGNTVDSINEIIDGGGQIQTADVEELSALLAQLTAASPEELQASAAELEATLPGTLALLESGSGIIPDDPAVLDAITATRDLAAVIDLDLSGPIDVGDATPAPTDPSAEPTDAPVEPTDVPAEPTPAPSGGNATVAPTATPPPPPRSTPTATADNRAPPGFLP